MKNDLRDISSESEEFKYIEQAILDELSEKNITCAQLLQSGNKLMLVIDKSKLSPINQTIINSINVTYGCVMVGINDMSNPFDYTQMYGDNSEKPNEKVPPNDVNAWEYLTQKLANEYYEKFRYVGIELNINQLSSITLIIGYYLEFINPLLIQDVCGYDDMVVVGEDDERRHRKFVESGILDKEPVSLQIDFSQDLSLFFGGLNCYNDPWLAKIYISNINGGSGIDNAIEVKLSKAHIAKNVMEYYAKKGITPPQNPSLGSCIRTPLISDPDIPEF